MIVAAKMNCLQKISMKLSYDFLSTINKKKEPNRITKMKILRSSLKTGKMKCDELTKPNINKDWYETIICMWNTHPDNKSH
jgi:hypothetical protein